VSVTTRSPLICLPELLRKRGEGERCPLSLDPGNDVPNALVGATSRAPPNMQRPGRAGQSVRLHVVRLVDCHRIVACRPAQLMRDSANDHFTDHLVGSGAAELHPAASRSKDHVVDPHGDRGPGAARHRLEPRLRSASPHLIAPRAAYELGTAAEDSNRRAVIPGWRARFDFPGQHGPLKPQAVGAASAAFFAWEPCKQMAASGPLFFCC
jgi:hypothetical protein